MDELDKYLENPDTKIEIMRQKASYDFNLLKPSQAEIKQIIEFWCELLTTKAVSDHRYFGDFPRDEL